MRLVTNRRSEGNDDIGEDTGRKNDYRSASVFTRKSIKAKTEPNHSAPSVYKRRRILAATAVLATARRRQKRTQRTVFIKAIKQCQNDGQPTAAQYVRAEDPVFAAENEKCNQNPKSRVTLRKAIHKETSCVFTAGVCNLL